MTTTIETRLSLDVGRSRSLCIMFDSEVESKPSIFFANDELCSPNDLIEEPQP
jgi:hypothetical protein